MVLPLLPLFLKIQLSFLYVEVSTFLHACEGDAVTRLTNAKIPYFNAPIYLQNKTQIGKVDEIFGPINESVSSQRSPTFYSLVLVCRSCLVQGFDLVLVLLWQYFSIKMMEGIVATSYSSGDKFFIDPAKLLPLERFLPQPKYVYSSFVRFVL